MAYHILKGVLGAKDKCPSHGLSRSLAMEERRLGRYEDHMSMETCWKI